MTDRLFLAFYGDDFTGSTDALEYLTRAGIRTILFLDDPTPQMIEELGDFDAIGIAGKTRAMIPDEMTQELNRTLPILRDLNPAHVHYKVCSTFDSSPEIGNIGTAIEIGSQIFQNDFIPVLVAAPHLGRYSAFGNLFARMGIGSQGAIHRLDRHPSMRAHPITPALESDLLLHLSEQTHTPIGLIDLLDLAQPISTIIDNLNRQLASGKSIIFFDAMYDHQMAIIGEVLERKADKHMPLFSIGSSGIEKALGDFWIKQGIVNRNNQWKSVFKCSPILVLSGSVSPVTAAQIKWAVNHGFDEIAVHAEVMQDEDLTPFIAEYQEKIVVSLQKGNSVILHTAKGPQDARIPKIKAILDNKDWDNQMRRTQTAKIFGSVLGQTARQALAQVAVKRLVIAGGDTSSLVASELGIKAVEMIAPLYPGAPLCRAYAHGAPVDGIEVNLKGGQVGDEIYFGVLQNGKTRIS